MGRFLASRGKRLLLGMLVLAALAGVGWWQRVTLLTWYYVGGLAGAEEADREAWVARVASLDGAALPALLACLRRDDPRACANAGAALVFLVRQWGNGDSLTLQAAEQAAERFPSLSTSGRQSALDLILVLLQAQSGGDHVPAALAKAARRMLIAAAPMPDPGVQSRALVMAEVLVDGIPPEESEALCALVRAGLKCPEVDSKIRAIHLTLHPVLRTDPDLLAQVVPLLRDPTPPVRRAALLAVGMAEKAISQDELLPLLHDPDANVRRLCEGALRSRGLQDSHLQLARLISDARPAARLDVLSLLRGTTDLEPGVWLQRLSRDPSPAVRAAAVRAVANQSQVDLRDRLRQIAQDDPSPTVRQLAGHYWRQHVQEITGPRP